MRSRCIALLGVAILGGCSERIDLPPEPQNEGGPTGEIAYVVQYRWNDVPEFGDMVLTSAASQAPVPDAG